MMMQITKKQEERLLRIRQFMVEPYHPVTGEKYHEAVQSVSFLLKLIDKVGLQVIGGPADDAMKSKEEVVGD